MSLFSEWNADIDSIQTQEDYNNFWNAYLETETNIYKCILNEKTTCLSGTVAELAEKYKATTKQFIGFLDGANTSFSNELDLEPYTEETVVKADLDFEKLLWNMHEAKADWLFKLEEWNDIFSEEKQKEIAKEFNRSKQAVSEKIGRNDPCPCGSGKKYKKCCGKNA